MAFYFFNELCFLFFSTTKYVTTFYSKFPTEIIYFNSRIWDDRDQGVTPKTWRERSKQNPRYNSIFRFSRSLNPILGISFRFNPTPPVTVDFRHVIPLIYMFSGSLNSIRGFIFLSNPTEVRQYGIQQFVGWYSICLVVPFYKTGGGECKFENKPRNRVQRPWNLINRIPLAPTGGNFPGGEILGWMNGWAVGWSSKWMVCKVQEKLQRSIKVRLVGEGMNIPWVSLWEIFSA